MTGAAGANCGWPYPPLGAEGALPPYPLPWTDATNKDSKTNWKEKQ